MTKTFILSHQTICQLLEAHASMAAWYYELSGALRAAGATVKAPDEQHRLAFLQQLAANFPEVAEAARGIEHPQAYIPPPAIVTTPTMSAPAPPPAAAYGAPPAAQEPTAPPATATSERVPEPDAVPPAAAVVPPAVMEALEAGAELAQQPLAGEDEGAPPQSQKGAGAVAPPPMVDPKKVRYD